MTREEIKAAADASWGVDGTQPAVPSPGREPGETETRLLLVTLKRPVKLPICFLDAIREGGIEKIAAL